MGVIRFGAFSRSSSKSSRPILYSSIPLEALREERDGDAFLKRLNATNRIYRLDVGSKGYGVALSSAATARERYRRRCRLIEKRIKICNWSVGIALSGLALAIFDVELNIGGLIHSNQIVNLSNFLRTCIILQTVLLDFLIITHHLIEDKIISTDTGYKTTSFSKFTCFRMALELMICSCCPLPGNGYVNWPNMANNSAFVEKPVNVPIHVLMTVPMFLRLYLVGRFMVLHSAIHQNPSTRAIASFNQVLVDFSFVLKTLLCERPLSILTGSTITFWAVMTWIMTQCERFGTNNMNSSSYYLLDYAWFEVVTFFAIGFGDIEMTTYCGRSVAIFTGLVGAVISSLITVIVSQKILLTLAEHRVNQVIAESQLSKIHKNEAARVLQWTWRVVCLRKRYEKAFSEKNNSKAIIFHLRMAQRNLLIAIISFRRCRWDLRVRKEEEDDVITIQRAFYETENRLKSIRQRQQQLAQHLSHLIGVVDELTETLSQKYGNFPKFTSVKIISNPLIKKISIEK